MAEIIWTSNALIDIDQIAEFISADSLYYAQQFVHKLLVSTNKLRKYPEIGKRLPEISSPDYREILFRKYRIIYKYSGEQVFIITVHHSARLLTNNKNLKDLFE